MIISNFNELGLSGFDMTDIHHMKVSINFQISTFLGSGLIPRFSRVPSKESKRTLVVLEKSLVGLGHNGYIIYA